MPSSPNGVDEWLLVEERDRAEAELGVVGEAFGDERTDAAGPDDERRPDALPDNAGTLLRPVPRETAGTHVRERERPEPYGLGAEVGGRAEQDAPREDEHRGERRRPEDRPEVVEHMDPEPEAIQTPRPVERETENDEVADVADGGEATPAACPPTTTAIAARSSIAASTPKHASAHAVAGRRPDRACATSARRFNPRRIERGLHRAPSADARDPYARCLATRRSAAPSRISPSAPAAMRLRSSPVNGRPPLDCDRRRASAGLTAGGAAGRAAGRASS